MSGKHGNSNEVDRVKKISLDRSQRLVAELRTNLKRRKGQLTARRDAGILGENSPKGRNKLIDSS